MNGLSDQQLLCDYSGRGSEAAFAELVRRHVDLVYSAAMRMVCDIHLAEDVTQNAFAALARNVGQLGDRSVLSGWLHRTTQNIAAQTVRTEVRRRAREQEAVSMNELLSPDSEPRWEEIAPHLDEALGELDEAERDALMLRYFERKSAREMAQTLGIGEQAAQKRVNRAVERLREFFAKRGVTAGAGGLAAVLSAHAVQAAPAGLAVLISTSALVGGTTLAATVTSAKTIAMTLIQKTLISAVIVASAGTGIYEFRQAARLRGQVQTLQLQQAPLTEQVAKLKAENVRLSSLAEQNRDSQALSRSQFNELLKLRGNATLAKTDSRELAQLKSTLAQQSGKMPDFFTNAMAMGMSTAEKWKQKDSLARLVRMKKMLNLTDEQERGIREIMMAHIQLQSQKTLDVMLGKLTTEQLQAQAGETGNQETEIKALLAPDQLAAFPDYMQAEKTTSADTYAKSYASQLADKYGLSKEQQEKLSSLLYEMRMKEPDMNQQAIDQAKASGKLADVLNMSADLEKSQLEAKLKILGDFLSPEQMTTYRQEQTDRIALLSNAMKMMIPQKPAGTTN
jgi:RNA polymerase sigma factor (sigma-70 family)